VVTAVHKRGMTGPLQAKRATGPFTDEPPKCLVILLLLPLHGSPPALLSLPLALLEPP
jgi:hypothetical protein